jgi:hypothetical protein
VMDCGVWAAETSGQRAARRVAKGRARRRMEGV